jgi:hypothetical protein
MSQVKNHSLSAGRLAGGALVVLSGFVPQPSTTTGHIIRSAQAAKVTVPVTAKLVSGITLSNATAALNFGSFVATAKTGNYTLKASDGAANGQVKVIAAAPQNRGKFKIKFAIDKSLDFKVSKIGADFTLSSIGTLKQGDVTLKSINIGKVLDGAGASKKLVIAAATKTTAKGTFNPKGTLAGAAQQASYGGQLSWTGARPLGNVTNSNGGLIVLTVTY